MKILVARQSGDATSREKLDADAQNLPLSSNDEIAGSTDRDAFDMRKLGVEQETKVQAHYLII